MTIMTACKKKNACDTLIVRFIDVGKGDCIVISCGGSTVMIDAGYSSTAGSVLSQLSDTGIERLDGLIVTHYDKDHAGGAAEIVSSIPVAALYLPGYDSGNEQQSKLMNAAEKSGISTKKVTEDISFTLGTAVLKIYASDIEYSPGGSKGEGNDNDVSLVISLTNGNDSFLFTGDIEKAGIKSFLKKCSSRFDVMKLPHHGRKCSNTDKLIETVQPKTAVITDSAEDPADKKTLSLLEDTDIYRSALCGNIMIESSGNGKYKVTSERK